MLGKRIVTCGVFLVGALIACGDRTGLPLEPLVCKQTAVGVIPKVPNLYFVLDRSRSMLEATIAGSTLSKWDLVRSDIADLMVALGSKADFGATVFPPYADVTDRADLCAAGQEVLKLRPGDGLPVDSPGSTAGDFWDDTLPAPLGGTPTAATFMTLTPELAGFAGRTFAVLATDGGPNCDTSLTCSAATCTANIDMVVAQCFPGGPNCCGPDGVAGPIDCLDGAGTVAAVTALAHAGVKTFAIGVPGSDAPQYVNVLNHVAQAGGTARATEPYYYPVKSQTDLVSALTDIAARITACTLQLKENPSDPTQVNVAVNRTIIPQSGPDGWTLDGDIVTLSGQTCDQAVAGGKVLITFGCPTVL
jgi:hypothetical protein